MNDSSHPNQFACVIHICMQTLKANLQISMIYQNPAQVFYMHTVLIAAKNEIESRDIHLACTNQIAH